MVIIMKKIAFCEYKIIDLKESFVYSSSHCMYVERILS